MLSLPDELTQYWLSYSLEKSSPAYFQVSEAGNLIDWGGSIERYYQQNLQTGDFIGDCFPFLAHAFPMQNVTESMQWIETEEGLILDAHFHFGASTGWILLIESGDEAQKVQSLMQQGNELKLLRHKYDKIVQRQLERQESSLILESLLNLSPDSTSEGISILQIRLNRQSPEEDVAAPDALEDLNLQLRAIFRNAVEQGGVIHHVFGQSVAVLFGLLPSPLSSAQQALQTAHCLISEWQDNFIGEDKLEISMGMGITTGQLDIDIRAVKNRKIFHLIGQTIVRAEEMLLVLNPGFLLIDQNTFSLVQASQSHFEPWSPNGPVKSSDTSFYAQSLNE